MCKRELLAAAAPLSKDPPTTKSKLWFLSLSRELDGSKLPSYAPYSLRIGLIASAALACCLATGVRAEDATNSGAGKDPAAVAASVERLAGSLFGGGHAQTVEPTVSHTAEATRDVSSLATTRRDSVDASAIKEAVVLPTDLPKEALAPPAPQPEKSIIGSVAAQPSTAASAVQGSVAQNSAMSAETERKTLEEKFEKARVAANHGEFGQARKIWELLAQLGHADAQYSLGRLYARGDGVQRDFSQARHYFELAAAQNHARALHSLGIMARNGDGQPKNEEKALAYFQRARDAGYEPAKDSIKDLFK